MGKLQKLPANQQIAVAQSLLTSLRTKDIQIYLSDPAAGRLLSQHGRDGALARGLGGGLTIVDSNQGVNKANAFTTVTYTDNVTLDASDGTATHHLTITYRFDSAADPSMRTFLYGRDYYVTYLRVYTPAGARLIAQDGFNGTYFGRRYWQMGTSDEHGRRMWAGYVFVPDGRDHSLHLVWSIPKAVTRDPAGRLRYSLEVQHQAGSDQRRRLTVTATGARSPALTCRGALDQDRVFALAALPGADTTTACGPAA